MRIGTLKGGFGVTYVFIFLIGITLGITFEKILFKKVNIGTLKIDNSDEDGPYLFLELSKSISSFNKCKQVLMTVKEENYIPHE